MTLRSRLAWTFGIAVFVLVMLLASISLAAIDRSLRSAVDTRVTAAATAASGLVDVHHGHLVLDPEDARNITATLPPDTQAAVVGVRGVLFTTSTGRLPAGIDTAVNASESSRIETIGSGEAKSRAAFAPVMRGGITFGYVVVWEGIDFVDEFDRNAIVAIGFGALLIGGVVVVLSSTLAQRALAPLERFTELATEIEAHDLSRRIGSSKEDELGRLASAFDRMLDRLQAAFSRQRQFTADASHELRAPLAVIRAEADVALDRERSVEEYRSALSSIVTEVNRMDSLVDALLSAARADSIKLQVEDVDLTELLTLTVSRFAQASASRAITIECAFEELCVPIDGAALERALAAILHNALDFARQRINVRAFARPDVAVVEVQDDGGGFSAEALAHAKERFWRGDPARTRGGSGLGLSIADAIARAHGGSLELRNALPQGAIVSVHIPFIGASSRPSTMGA